MNLESMPQPVRMSEKCSLDQLPNFQRAGGSDVKMVSLFEQKRLKGFWPFYDEVGGVRQLTVTTAYLILQLLTCLPGHRCICLWADWCLHMEGLFVLVFLSTKWGSNLGALY